MKKVPDSLLVLGRSPDHWKSSQSIVPNLQRSFEHALVNTSIFRATDGIRSAQKLADLVVTNRINHIIFLDHKPHPWLHLQELSKLASPPQIFLMVYGDFTYWRRKWRACSKFLSKLPMHFICASQAQKALLESCFSRGAAISTLPHPVDARKFHFSENLRRKGRHLLQMNGNCLHFVYSGRISLQKNPIRMINDLLLAERETGIPIHIWLTGGGDSVAGDSFGHRFPNNFYPIYFKSRIQELLPMWQQRIHFLGDLSIKELNQVYCAADAFVSLSTHHDEDYGMFIAESLMTGLPGILSRWGGFADFEGSPGVVGIPLHLGPKGLEVESRQIPMACKRLFRNRALWAERREKLSERAKSRFSIESHTATLEAILRLPPRKGLSLSPQFLRYSQKDTPFPGGPSSARNYMGIYAPYLGRALSP